MQNTDAVPVTFPLLVLPGKVAITVTGSGVECRHVAVPLVLSWLLLTGTSTGSDVDHVMPKEGTVGAVQPDGTMAAAPNCCESLPDPWVRVTFWGKTETVVVQVVALLVVGLL